MFRKDSATTTSEKQPAEQPVPLSPAQVKFVGPDTARLEKQLANVRLKRKTKAHHVKLLKLVPDLLALQRLGASLGELSDWCDTRGVKASISTIRRLLAEKEAKA